MEKEELIKQGKTELHENDEIYGIKVPRRSCRYCYGTGKEGWDLSGDPILCRCLRRSGEGEWITMIEFKRICENRRPNERLINNPQPDEIYTSEDTTNS